MTIEAFDLGMTFECSIVHSCFPFPKVTVSLDVCKLQ